MSIQLSDTTLQENSPKSLVNVGLTAAAGGGLGNTTGIVSAEKIKAKKRSNKRKWTLKRYVEKLMPGTRQSYCMRFSGGNAVKLHYNANIHNATYRNLAHCDNPWTCPVCSEKINARRREEVLHTVTEWEAMGGMTLMLTYTMQHDRTDDADVITTQLRNAYRKLWKDRVGQNLKQKYGIKHTISHLDVTLGENGWHPHLHVIVFVDPTVASGENIDFFNDEKLREHVESDVGPEWIRCLNHFGGDATLEHGLLASTGDQFRRDYLAKFGKMLVRDYKRTIAYEITSNRSKQLKGLHPFEVLELSQGKAKSYYGRKWHEYVLFTKHRKQLTWSPGLKALVGLDDLTDTEVVEEHNEQDVEVYEIPYLTWEAVLHFEQRGKLLNYCVQHQGNVKKIERWVDRLDRRYAEYMRKKSIADRHEQQKWEVGTIWDREGNKARFDNPVLSVDS